VNVQLDTMNHMHKIVHSVAINVTAVKLHLHNVLNVLKTELVNLLVLAQMDIIMLKMLLNVPNVTNNV